ncbi:unnamed protein product [Ceratitis capitata]|uniref:(Mediterranean fruit fly) hypothetical protein n=1 Tax=Ceratitis capitata TaxID=7213 RepID=A0A811UVF8_CERCA|nr:unnamed protein product [Ceratitis capitata]
MAVVHDNENLSAVLVRDDCASMICQEDMKHEQDCMITPCNHMAINLHDRARAQEAVPRYHTGQSQSRLYEGGYSNMPRDDTSSFPSLEVRNSPSIENNNNTHHAAPKKHLRGGSLWCQECLQAIMPDESEKRGDTGAAQLKLQYDSISSVPAISAAPKTHQVVGGLIVDIQRSD